MRHGWFGAIAEPQRESVGGATPRAGATPRRTSRWASGCPVIIVMSMRRKRRRSRWTVISPLVAASAGIRGGFGGWFWRRESWVRCGRSWRRRWRGW